MNTEKIIKEGVTGITLELNISEVNTLKQMVQDNLQLFESDSHFIKRNYSHKEQINASKYLLYWLEGVLELGVSQNDALKSLGMDKIIDSCNNKD